MNQVVRSGEICEVQAYRFGPFTLMPEQRVLVRDREPVRLRGREYETLLALIEHAGTFLSKDELAERIWPSTIVSENNLRVQIGALRRVLGDGKGNSRYIITVNNRGYCFCHPVEIVNDGNGDQASPVERSGAPAGAGLGAARQLVGRGDDIDAVQAQLDHRRLVTIVGMGGVGKTSLATNIARARQSHYADGIRFADFAGISGARQVVPAMAGALGLPMAGATIEDDLIDLLNDMDVLLLLDNCEHVIDAVAAIVDRVLMQTPCVTILATSREPLRVETEAVYRLQSLVTAEPETCRDLAAVMAVPAVQMFIERARACDNNFKVTDDDVEAIFALCRSLDGNPLAIELAAARVAQFGVRNLAFQVADSFQLLTNGRRTSAPRHQTIRGMLDWSFGILPERERRILACLSVFRGEFTRDVAAEVCAGIETGLTDLELVNLLAELAAKSLLTVESSEPVPRYRMLYLTRMYAREKCQEAGRWRQVCALHAAAYLSRVKAIDGTGGDAAESLKPELEDIRAAVEWSFSPDGDVLVGVPLMMMALEMGLKISLYRDCAAMVDRALGFLTAEERLEPRTELKLLVVKRQLDFHSPAGQAQNPLTLNRIVKLVDEIGDRHGDMHVIFEPFVTFASQAFEAGIYPEVLRLGDHLTAMVETGCQDGYVGLTADRTRAQGLYFMGQQVEADALLDKVITGAPAIVRPSDLHHRGKVNPVISARIMRARGLWARGMAEQATAEAAAAFRMATEVHEHTQCYVLGFASIPISLWRGDRAMARNQMALLAQMAQQEGLRYWCGWVDYYESVLLHLDNADALASLSGRIVQQLSDVGMAIPVSNAPQQDLLPTLHPTLFSPVAFRRVEDGLVGWSAAENWRLHAEVLLASDGAAAEVEAWLGKAAEYVEREALHGFGLRVAESRARVAMKLGNRKDASRRLAAAMARVQEGRNDADYLRAQRCLYDLE